MSERSCARSSLSQKMAAAPVARARETASLTQSWIGASFVWHMRQMSPCSTSCEKTVSSVALSTTRITPFDATSNVLSCEPYSSAFCAMSPTFETAPIVDTSNLPLTWQSSTIAWYCLA